MALLSRIAHGLSYYICYLLFYISLPATAVGALRPDRARNFSISVISSTHTVSTCLQQRATACHFTTQTRTRHGILNHRLHWRNTGVRDTWLGRVVRNGLLSSHERGAFLLRFSFLALARRPAVDVWAGQKRGFAPWLDAGF